jgi:hypothetical protein
MHGLPQICLYDFLIELIFSARRKSPSESFNCFRLFSSIFYAVVNIYDSVSHMHLAVFHIYGLPSDHADVYDYQVCFVDLTFLDEGAGYILGTSFTLPHGFSCWV